MRYGVSAGSWAINLRLKIFQSPGPGPGPVPVPDPVPVQGGFDKGNVIRLFKIQKMSILDRDAFRIPCHGDDEAFYVLGVLTTRITFASGGMRTQW